MKRKATQTLNCNASASSSSQPTRCSTTLSLSGVFFFLTVSISHSLGRPPFFSFALFSLDSSLFFRLCFLNFLLSVFIWSKCSLFHFEPVILGRRSLSCAGLYAMHACVLVCVLLCSFVFCLANAAFYIQAHLLCWCTFNTHRANNRQHTHNCCVH